MAEKKTIREHLQTLPDPYGPQALTNMWWEYENDKYKDPGEALYQAFTWSQSPQGYKYWNWVRETFF